MAFRVWLKLDTGAAQRLRAMKDGAGELGQQIVADAADITKEYTVQNLSGVPFTSQTGTHIINKRTGRGAASVQVQHPYGSPFRARLFASAMSSYADNPPVNYLYILEHGRGEVRPKYTPAMQEGRSSAARLVIPGGQHYLVSGQNGFRGQSGYYRFVRRLPPMEGKHWMQAAAQAATPEIQSHSNELVHDYLNGR